MSTKADFIYGSRVNVNESYLKIFDGIIPIKIENNNEKIYKDHSKFLKNFNAFNV